METFRLVILVPSVFLALENGEKLRYISSPLPKYGKIYITRYMYVALRN